MTSLLAMLYLVLFGTLAIGFYAATTTQSQIVSNDERVALAQMAAESGMDFMRYQLGRVTINPTTPPEVVLSELYADLREQLEDTSNLGSQHIALVGNTIQIPENGGTLKLDSVGNSRFRATITDWAGEIVVKIDGMNGTTQASRAITMDFTRAPHPSNVFDYAVASKGQVVMKKGSVTSVDGVDPAIAKMMSAMGVDPSITVTGGLIGGELNITESGGVTVTGGTVAGTSIPAVILSDHVYVVDEPEFPIINTDVYLPYASNTYSNGKKLQQNIRIPRGTNPRFNGGDTVQGIMYIESPNTVTFRGDFDLQGFIVFENANDSSVNIMDFRGSVNQAPLPSGPQFDPLRATSGVAILGPTVGMKMSGASSSYLRGNVIVGSFFYDGSADTQIDKGTIMTYNQTPNAAVFDGKGIKFTATGSSNMPTAGVTYNTYYAPDASSYQEVSP
jgi:hypothetical protein